MRRLLVLAFLALAVAGCGGSADREDATLWVTRDKGAEVVLTHAVPSGLSAIRVLARETNVDTSYGGRFVQGVNGLADDVASQRSWFYFVNGIEADRGGAEYRVRQGDVIWWDYRSWKGAAMRRPVVVGAFPEPFLHGYGGRARPAAVRYASKDAQAVALGLANLIGATSVELIDVPAAEGANLLRIVDGQVDFSAALRSTEGTAGSPVVFTISVADGRRLLAHPRLARHRFEGLP